MSKPHITTRRDRRSKKYRNLHRRLRDELAKQARKRDASERFRKTGNVA
jgi:hypothetical protein